MNLLNGVLGAHREDNAEGASMDSENTSTDLLREFKNRPSLSRRLRNRKRKIKRKRKSKRKSKRKRLKLPNKKLK